MKPGTPHENPARNARSAYEGNRVYKVDSVSACERPGSTDYVDQLLSEKLNLVRRHLQEGRLVDLCCATGQHLWSLRLPEQDVIGIDFSLPFLLAAEKARSNVGVSNVMFIAADARSLPLASASVATVYSLSALYQVPEIDRVFAEVSRVLRPGGRCILDLGNSYSINSFCVRRYYTELPPSYAIPVTQMRDLFVRNEMRILEHRTFQILPLWAGRPRWLWPLLHPIWRRLFVKRFNGRMLDEWISSLPFVRRFAFRHVIVGEKLG